MLALPDKLPRRCLGNPELPVRLAGLLVDIDARARRLLLGRHRTLDACGGKTVCVDISALKPERYRLGELYEFIGVLLPLDPADGRRGACAFVVSVFWGRWVGGCADAEHPEELLDHMARCIDAIEIARRVAAYGNGHHDRDRETAPPQ
jgi:hypothetical protein